VHRAKTAVVVVVLLLSACGARLGKSVRTEAADAALHPGTLGAGGGAGSQVAGAGAGAGAGLAQTGGATTGGASALSPGQAASSSGALGGTVGQQAGTAGLTPSAPSGGNGGATDVGVTATTITTGNVADLSGPVPGLFQGTVYGTDAYFAYTNSQAGIFGRKLKMLSADSQTDCTADQNAHTNLIPKVFAFVGSFELYDDCGTQIEEQHPDVPDISYALGPGTKKNTVSRFSPQMAPPGYQDGMFCTWKQQFGDAVTKAGSIYANLPSAAFSQRMILNAAEQGCGWRFIDSIPVGATQTTFNAEMAKMQSDGVKVVFEIATTQGNIAEMKREADQQNWHPIWTAPVFYASDSIQRLGNAQEAEGMVGSNLYSLFFSADEAKNIAEVGLFQRWMQLTHPDAPLDLFAMFAWAAAKLFVQEVKAVGPDLTRKAFLAAIRTVHAYDGGGIINLNDIGNHRPSNCYVLWRVHNGQFVRYDTPATQYRCDGGFIPYTGS